ncbi:hypothetical protein U8V72_25765 [Priestia filamentosa]|uniref:hypothetical protein n=1 Tax=Priestia filamentosa TaxID=1402861 RepID=UPI00397BCF24
MTNTLTKEQIKVIKTYNKEYRTYRNATFSGENCKVTISPVKEENKSHNVQIGYSKDGCKIIYEVQDKTLVATTFNPESRGIFIGFDEIHAKDGLQYLLGLASALKLEFLVIQMKYMSEDNHYKVFTDQGFTYEKSKYGREVIFTLNFHSGKYFALREKYLALQEVLTYLKQDNKAFECEFFNYSNGPKYLHYQFTYYFVGNEGKFSLGIDENGIHLQERELGIITYMSYDSLQDVLTVSEAISAFLNTIKKSQEQNVFRKLSGKFFEEIAPMRLDVKRKFYSQILEHLSLEYTQEEFDTRLKEGDFSSIREFVSYPFTLTFSRILDVFFITNSEKELKFFSKDQKEEAKEEFKKLSMIAYEKKIDQTLDFVSGDAVDEEENN